MTGELLVGLYVFILACFAGFELITKVPPTLHTPLMSGSNAISGVTILGALACVNYAADSGSTAAIANYIGLFAIIMATINCVGGFMVTNRMLAMFKR